MLRLLAPALILLFLAGCSVPTAATPTPPTADLAPTLPLATFTPATDLTVIPTGVATPEPTDAPAPEASPTPLSNFWQMIYPGIDVTRTESGLQVLRHAPNLVTYGVLFESDPDKAQQLSDWLDQAPDAIAAVNCGFYWEKEGQYLHMGLLEVNEQRLAQVRPKWGAALVVRDGKASIVRQPKKTIPPMTFGLQGWPTLLSQGQLVDLTGIDQGEIARRTAVGVDSSGRVLWIVDNLGSTLGDFARTLQQADLDLVDVVNLDGGASTGLRWRPDPAGKQTGVDSLPIPCAITLSPPQP